MKIAPSENIVLLLHPCVNVPCSFVVLRNLTLDGKLCLYDDKNGAFVELKVRSHELVLSDFLCRRQNWRTFKRATCDLDMLISF